MGEIRTVTNRSGGIQGGISNGENIILQRLSQRLQFARAAQSTVRAQKRYWQLRKTRSLRVT